MTEPVQPCCPTCATPIRALQGTPGVVAVYPCGGWITWEDAQDLADEYGKKIR